MARDFNLFKEEIRGKKVAVVGIGVSNIPLISFLIKLGARITAFDKRNMENLDSRALSFKDDIEFSLGENYLEGLRGFDYVFRTPGMRPDNPYLVKAREEGAVITSEMKEFMRHCRGKLIAVTGSDGKSTTTTLIYELLKKEGYTSWLGGNIGFPLFDKVEEIKEEDMVVLELSSFQLMDLNVSPEIAVITNMSPNHLDVHKDMEEYIDAKKNIFKFQDENGILILNDDNEITHSIKGEEKGELKVFSSKNTVSQGYFKDDVLYLKNSPVVRLSEMKLPGVYNAENMLAAFLAAEGLCSPKTMKEVALNFAGVKHRNQFIKELDGVKYYNNSIASSPTRTIASVKSFKNKEGKIVIILGGYDKNLDYHELAKVGMTWFKKIVLCGASSPKIEKAFIDVDREKAEQLIVHAKDYNEAVNLLREHSSSGDVAMLSPACASFDLFKNFEVRGDKFTELVMNLR